MKASATVATEEMFVMVACLRPGHVVVDLIPNGGRRLVLEVAGPTASCCYWIRLDGDQMALELATRVVRVTRMSHDLMKGSA